MINKIKAFAIPALCGALAWWAILGIWGWKAPGAVAERVAEGRQTGANEVFAAACAKDVMAQPDALKELGASQAYNKGDVVKKFVKGLDNRDLDWRVANACAEKVTELAKKSATKS